MKTINVLVVEAGKAPHEEKIGCDLASLQKMVGGSIEAIQPFEDKVLVICNEEGKLQGLPLNRGLTDEDGEIYDVIAGTFLVCGFGKGDFATLPSALIEKYKAHFEYPEVFMRTSGGIKVVKGQPTHQKQHKPSEQER